MSRYRVVAAPGGVMLALVVLVVIPFADADTGFLESIEVQPDTTESPESTGPEFSEVPTNVTVVLGQPATLRCSATGNPPPRVVWHSRKTGRVKPDASLGIKVDDVGIHWERVGKEEEGLYRCTAKSTVGTRHSEFAYLKVLAETHISEYPGGYSINYGTTLLMQCVALGDPIPEIEWFRDGEPLPMYEWKNEVIHGIEFTPFTTYARSVLTVNATATANYTCSADNVIQGRRTSDSRTFTVSVVHPVSPIRRPLGYCAPYNGRVCRHHLGGTGLVWYNITATDKGGWLNEHITRELWAEMIDNFREPCRTAAEKLLCRYAFPECHLEDGYQVGLPLCREDCIAVRSLFCVNEWLLIEQNKQENRVFKSRRHFRLPDCEKLESFGDGSRRVCSHIGLTSINPDEVTYDCRIGRGRWYFGTKNVTSNGIACQRWDSQTPHSHHRPPDVFPEVQDAENYCRNAGGEEPYPWCYTTDPKIRWQHCSIPLCGEESIGTGVGLANEMHDEELLSPWLMLIAGGAGLGGLLLLALSALLIHKLVQTRHGYSTPNNQEADIDLTKLPSNSAYHQTCAQLNPKLEKLQYDRNSIIYIRDLGQGAFGRVFQGRAPGLVPGEELTMVAVKVLKEEASEDMLGDFEREACILAEFDHPNIVRLLGVCAVGRPMCLLFEYMGRGDLNEFLRSCSPTNYIVRSSNGDTFSDTKLNYKDMLWIATQIAAGMVYLSDRKFVHRDLATRNCLIGEDMTVKIADFGLSQKIYIADYYRGDDSDAIPIRWMPLESILYNKYTVESDVWAFGVCLWEIFSFALQPYYGMTHEEVVCFLKEGGILSCPEHCPPETFGIMTWCWQRRPHDRPSFPIIHKALTDLAAGRPVSVPFPPPSSAMSSSAPATPRPCSCAPEPSVQQV
ncbi:tyrosine-protein kinase transmembrane receptor Ror2-like isoform X3 [Macrobrachium rosenbergii]|uniref:tyrosine-protein kinase transmembrane receptor Ror2-like isoform X3 n=1 Tax=Macrobrachium rosenbergii TaxID=79674 RepID=UPI0034D68BEE